MRFRFISKGTYVNFVQQFRQNSCCIYEEKLKPNNTLILDEGRQGYEGYKGCKGVDGWVKVHPGPNDFEEAKETCDNEGNNANVR